MEPVTFGWILTAVGWIVTGVGWSIAASQANTRETRKEHRAVLTSLEATLDRLLAAYRSYVSEGEESPREQARLQVHSELNRVRRIVEWLQPLVGGGLMKRFEEFYEVVTGGDFESKSRAGQGNNYGRIAGSAETLIDTTEHWFRDRYH